MQKDRLLIAILPVIIMLFIWAGCDAGASIRSLPDTGNTFTPAATEPETASPDFDFIFRYGIYARNTLDTFEGTYTKDMVADPSIRIDLILTGDEKTIIYRKMVEISFFDYPDVFTVSVPRGGEKGIRTPYSSYYFKVEYESEIKELWWADNIVLKDSIDKEAENLKGLTELIRDIIESREEYQKLPEPRSAYQ